MHTHFPERIVKCQLRAEWFEVILIDRLCEPDIILPEAFQPDTEDWILLTYQFCLTPDLGTAGERRVPADESQEVLHHGILGHIEYDNRGHQRDDR